MPKAVRALRSPAFAAGRLTAGDWLIATTTAWLAPTVIAVPCLIGGYLAYFAETALQSTFVAVSGLLFALAYGLFLSPVIGIPALAASGLTTWALIRAGWAGWAVLLPAGAFAGALSFWMVFGVLEITGPALGALYALLCKSTLIYHRPEIFTLR